MRGGVVILVRNDVTFLELPVEDHAATEVGRPLYSCSVLLLLQDGEVGALKLTGIYFPPKTVTSLGQVDRLTDASTMMTKCYKEPCDKIYFR